MASARHLGVYDIDLMLSWTPYDFKLLLKGSRHQKVDETEFMAQVALFHRQANNEKKTSIRKIFNAEKARAMLDGRGTNEAAVRRLHESLKTWKPDFKEKGGD